MTNQAHIPVMGDAAVAALCPRDNGIYVDGTFGAGGYTRKILDAANCRVIGFDRDPTAIAKAQGWVKDYGERLTLIERPFGEMAEALAEIGITAIDGLVLDLGVSSMQLDEGERGFSFMNPGPLNMRMDGDEQGLTAKRVVAEASEAQLADIIHFYGEDRKARSIARHIIRARNEKEITTTQELADIIVKAAGPVRPDRIHPATRSFQALRIFVNDELGQLVEALLGAEKILRQHGRLVVVTFHSLEDRIVKRFLKQRSGDIANPSRHLPQGAAGPAPSFQLASKKAFLPSDREIAENARARSAKMRVALRTNAPAPPIPADFNQRLGMPQTSNL